MVKQKSIHAKLKQLLQLTWPSQRSFADASEVHHATINEFFSREKNVTLLNFTKILKCLGVDIHVQIDRAIQSALGEKAIDKNQTNEDLASLINGLDKNQKREIIIRMINLNKLRENVKVFDAIERIEKRELFH